MTTTEFEWKQNINNRPLFRVLLDIYGNRPDQNSAELNAEIKSTFIFTDIGNFRLNRHQAQHLISVGAVKINDEIVPLTSILDPIKINASPREKIKIELDLNAVNELKKKIRIWTLDKPEGVVCTFAKTTKEEEVTLRDYLEEHTDLFETVTSELTLATNAERRKNKKEAKNQKKETKNQGDDDEEQQGDGEQQNDRGKKKNDSQAAALAPCPPLFPVGRLDKDSCGLLLLTNCGSLCERLLHPDFLHEKEYYVEIARERRRSRRRRERKVDYDDDDDHDDAVNNQDPGDIPDRFWQLMRDGVSWKSSGGSEPAYVTSKPCRVEPIAAQEMPNAENDGDRIAFFITLTQGLNRQIRNMVEAAGKQILKETNTKKSIAEEGYFVTCLRRLRMGPIRLRPQNESRNFSGVVELIGDEKEIFLNWAYGNTKMQEN